MKRTLSAGLFVLVLAACGDGGTGSGPSVVSVTVTPSSRTLAIAETVQLQAAIAMSDGSNPTNPQISWTTTNQSVATVTVSGLVTGVAAGTAKVIASFGGEADTADITVSAAPSGECTAANTINLAVGGSQTLSNTQAAQICLAGGAGANAEYTLVPHFASATGDASITLSVAASGVVAAAGPPNPSLAPRYALQFGSPGELAAKVADPGAAYHIRLRERSVPALSPLVEGAQQWYRNQRAIRRQVSGATPAVGDQLSLNVSQSFCSPTDYRTGRVEAVGQRSVVIADVANPANGLTTADYQHIAATFDTLVYPVDVAAFGEPQDLDANGRVLIFYTRAVNELTPADQDFIVGGFFYGRDLFPKVAGNGFPACGGSNVAEMFYMLAADPTGEVNGHVRSRTYIMNNTISTIAHEFQHLISASRRLYIHNATGTAWSEDAWLNEGLSHIAEELLFYRAGQGLGPRQNVDLPAIQASAARVNAANIYMLQNFGRYLEFIEAPQSNSVYQDDDDLATRGASWAFLRYVADRRNTDDVALWNALVNNTLVGLDNLQARIGTDPRAWVRDWVVSVYADDAVTAAPAVFTQPSWNFRSILPAINGGVFSLQTRQLPNGASTAVVLAGGAGAYLRTGVASGGRGSYQVTAAGAALPATITVTVLRTK